jgi:hypothetical protein
MSHQSALHRWFEAEVSLCADSAHDYLCHVNPWGDLYLYATRGSIIVARALPHHGYALVTPERVPGDRTREGLRAWIWERCRRVECLPVGEALPLDGEARERLGIVGRLAS